MRKYTCLLFVQKIYIKDKSETEEAGHLHGVGSKGVIRRGELEGSENPLSVYTLYVALTQHQSNVSCIQNINY